MKQIRKRLTYANVMSTIAVFLILGGATALAATKLGKNSVGTKQIKNNAVTSAKIKKNAITTKQIKNGSVTGAKVNTGSLGTVPSANTATTAGTANSLTGYSRMGMTRVVATPAASLKAGLENAPQTILFTAGPLTVYGQCVTEGTETDGVISIKTSLNGVIFDSDYDDASGDPSYLNTNTEVGERVLLREDAEANEADYFGGEATEFAAMSPDGTTVRGDDQIGVKNGTLAAGNGLYGEGNVCLFAGEMMTLNG